VADYRNCIDYRPKRLLKISLKRNQEDHVVGLAIGFAVMARDLEGDHGASCQEKPTEEASFNTPLQTVENRGEM
jgi:hypothetical protein